MSRIHKTLAFNCLVLLLCGCAASMPEVQFLSTPEFCEEIIQVNWDVGPKILQLATPEYPEMAIRFKREGLVVVLVSLSPQGGIRDAQICTGINPMLNKSAIAAARKCRYLPAKKNGVPVNSTIGVAYDYSFK